jgi:hypothetical protein
MVIIIPPRKIQKASSLSLNREAKQETRGAKLKRENVKIKKEEKKV